jgi:ectoine hydroxylase-related dioxygenase (phytanoyl-CoA dioxygenase family)
VYTKQALYDLGSSLNAITATQKRQLDDNGLFIVENVLSTDEITTMRSEFERLHAAEAGQGGHEVHVEPGARRLSNIFNKTDAFDKVLEIPEILAAST